MQGPCAACRRASDFKVASSQDRSSCIPIASPMPRSREPNARAAVARTCGHDVTHGVMEQTKHTLPCIENTLRTSGKGSTSAARRSGIKSGTYGAMSCHAQQVCWHLDETAQRSWLRWRMRPAPWAH